MATKETVNNNRFKLAKQQLNLHVHHAFFPWPLLPEYGLKCLMFYRGSEQQTTIFFSFTSPLEFISREIANIQRIERGGIKAMWLSILSHMLV